LPGLVGRKLINEHHLQQLNNVATQQPE
jgi:hypothetical protein